MFATQRLFPSTALLFLVSSAHAQLLFQQSIGGSDPDYASQVFTTTDGGYAFVGNTDSFGAGDDDMYLVKLDANGALVWTRTFGGTTLDDGRAGMQTSDGGYLVMGQTRSFGAPDQDVYAVKTDATGALQWSKRYAATGADYGTSVHQTADGGYLLGGSTSQGAGGIDALVIRTNANGDTLWTRTYGGALEEDGNALLPTPDGGFLVAGITHSSGAGGVDVLLLKADVNGAVTWVHTYGSADDDYAFSIDAVPGGGYVLAGTTRSSGAGGYDMFLLKVDGVGGLVWAKTYGGADTDLCGCVRTTTDGGQLLFGQSYSFGVESDLYLVKTDADGDTLWTRTYGGGGYEFESSFLQTADGGYLLAGGEESFGPARDAYLVKTDAQGHSGCNEGSTATLVGTATLTAATPTLTVSSFAATATVPATSTSAGDDVNTLCSTTGIGPEPAATLTIAVSPIPCATTFRVSGTARNGTLTVLDAAGRVCGVYSTAEGSTAIDAQGLRSGAYLLRYQQQDRSAVLRLLKE